MWKYITKQQCNEFLLSLNLIKEEIVDKEKIMKLYTYSNHIENCYHLSHIQKKSGGDRMICRPISTLKYIQRQILHNILENKEISQYAKAYHKNIGLVDNALPHVNQKIILKLDIQDFFNHIRFLDIYHSCFSIEYFPKPVGMLLTYLCTYYDSLPQGAPTSAYISNLVLKNFDEELGAWCGKKNIFYTRYSDDMTFSGNFHPTEVIQKVRKMLYPLGLKINRDKIHIVHSSQKQVVTGIVVNQKLNLEKNYKKKIRQELYYIQKFGIDSHLNQIGVLDKVQYLKSLQGRILFVLQIRKNDREFLSYQKFICNIIRTEKPKQ